MESPFESRFLGDNPAMAETLETDICCRIADGQLFFNAGLDCACIAPPRPLIYAVVRVAPAHAARSGLKKGQINKIWLCQKVGGRYLCGVRGRPTIPANTR
ncbi:MAG TPA: hypothetical protein VKT99_10865 [Xanthobacteraceae bacterium]|jgi:hypothetical protein|nr:hypothetical protein [Xanthobacteraceae bacterium]